MRRLLVDLVALLLTFTPVTAHAQVVVGAKGGVANANQELEDEVMPLENEGVTGIVGGVFLRVHLAPVVAIQPEAILVGKGTQIEDEALMASFEFGQTYLEIPVLLRLGFPAQGHSVRPYLLAGPAVAFELSCEESIEQPGTDDIEGSCGDPTLVGMGFRTQSTEFSALFGAGFDFDVGPLLVGLEGRYTLGLTDVTEAAAENVKNRGLAVFTSVGIRLR